MSAAGSSTCWGIDLGSMKTMVVARDGQIIRNELGGIGTASSVSFKGRERHIGEAAVAQATANPRNTILHVHRLVGRPHQDVVTKDAPLSAYYMFDVKEGPEGSPLVTVDYGEGRVSFPPYVLLGMLLGKLKSYTVEGTPVEGPLSLSISVPRGFPQTHMQEVVDAAHVAGVEDVSVVSSTDALLATYRQKHPAKEFGEGEVRKLLLVEMGHSQVSVVVAALGAQGPASVLAEATDACFGAANFDHRLFAHFAKHIASKYAGASVVPGDKKALRLLATVEKLRKNLSTIPEAHAQVENVVEGRDIDLSLKRDDFASLVAEEVAHFESLVQKALADSGVAAQDLAAVEISGGAMRMPLLQEALVRVTGFTRALGMKLDDAAVAFGAALLHHRAATETKANGQAEVRSAEPVANGTAAADGGAPEAEAKDEGPTLFRGPGRLSAQEVEQLRAEEAKRAETDREIHALHEAHNAIEAFILHLRGAPSHAKHGRLVDRATLEPWVDNLENWLYSEEADTASLQDFEAKLKSAKEEAGVMLKAFDEAVEADRVAYEKALEEEAKKAEAERDAAGDDDDHDNRKLKKPERMRMVLKNKDEGNELFGGGNFRPAAARYVKALTHCAKFFDLSPEDQQEVDTIRLSLYSNLAQCYLKLENWDAAIKNCEEALKINADFVKALYRRAVAYDAKRMHEEAEADLVKATELAPADKLVTNLLTRTRAAIKKQKDKEKSMWSKAFSG